MPSDRGSVTAETALALPSVVVVLAALLGAGQVLISRVSCIDAARAAARAASRAESDETVRALVGALLPGARVAVGPRARLVRVEVATEVLVPLPVPAVTMRCVAVAAEEVP